MLKKRDMLIILGLIVLLIVVRFPFLQVPLERDEGEYAYCAWQWQQGTIPYRDIVTSVSPGIFMLYGMAFKTLGKNIVHIRVFTLFFILLALVVLYLYARRVIGRLGALSAGLALIFLTTSQHMLSFMSQREVFLLLPMAVFICVLYHAVEKKNLFYFFLLGLLSACMLAIKQTTVFNVFFIVAVVGWMYWCDRQIWLLGRRIFLVGVGFTVAIIPFFAYFYLKDGLPEFIFWNFTYQKIMNDAAKLTMGEIFGLLVYRGAPSFWRYFSGQFPLSLLVGVSVFFAFIRKNREHRFHVIWYGIMAAAVCAGWHFRGQYFQLLAIPQSLLIGWGITYLWQLIKKLQSKKIYGAFFVFYLFMFLFPLVRVWQTYYFLSPQEISKKTYGPQAFFMAEPIAQYVKRESTPQDKLYVVGTEQEIYFYAQRECASPFITLYSLTYNFGDPRKRQEMVAEQLKADPPLFILVANNFCSHYDMPHVTDEKLIFTETQELVKRKYFLDGFAVFGERNWLVLGKQEVSKVMPEKLGFREEIRYIQNAFHRYPDILIYRRQNTNES